MFSRGKCSEENLFFHGPTVRIFIIQQMNPPRPMLRGSGRGRTLVDLFKLARRLGAKIMPPRMPHRMSECLDPLSITYKTLGPDLMKSSDFIGPTLNLAQSINCPSVSRRMTCD